MRLYPREKYLSRIRGFYDATDLIKVITGVRSCGKSSLLAVIREELLAKGVPKENIVTIDLEQKAFKSIQTAEDLDNWILKQENGAEVQYLFIEELQRIKDYEAVLNAVRLTDRWSIFVSGSHDALLNGPQITILVGRYMEFQMYPLTFEEYVDMKRWYDIPVESSLQREMKHYLADGGFPHVLFLKEPEYKRIYIQGVLREIFQKDIRPRLKIRDLKVFEAVFRYLLNHFGELMSLRGLSTTLRDGGMTVTRRTITRYIQALVDAKILWECPCFERNLQRPMVGEKKYYLADLSFYHCQSTDDAAPLVPMMENLVYTYAKSFGDNVYVGRLDNLLWSFIVQRYQKGYVYVQVVKSVQTSKVEEERIYRPLEAIGDDFTRYVVTQDKKFLQRSGIHHVNIVNFMGKGESFF